jgi:hypothetical protein
MDDRRIGRHQRLSLSARHGNVSYMHYEFGVLKELGPHMLSFSSLLYMHFCSNNDTKGEHSGHSKHAPTAAQFQGRLHWSLLPIHPAAIFGVCRRRNLSIAAQRGDYLDYCC